MSSEIIPRKEHNLFLKLIKALSLVFLGQKFLTLAINLNPNSMQIENQMAALKLPHRSEEQYASLLLSLCQEYQIDLKIYYEPIIIVDKNGQHLAVPDFKIVFPNGLVVYVEVTSQKEKTKNKVKQVMNKEGLGDNFLVVDGIRLKRASRSNNNQEIADLLLGNFASNL